ncbi:serine palmitoyltransferase 2 [Agrilus planipennis]|uniref:serine C-palmitoyltransferase n=1 Tax=Agrilus planipennis TaxID=224129 RepID=A0A1W4X4X2_AGRPL|nr:serine palmitoyltransferase 2 [Agrilus planipennis]
MATRMNQGAGDGSITEFWNGTIFENETKNELQKNGYNGHLINVCKEYPRNMVHIMNGHTYLNGHTSFSSVTKDIIESNGRILVEDGTLKANRNTTITPTNITKLSVIESDKFKLKESFEKPSLIITAIIHISFYILMFLGYLSQMLFPPKVVKEKSREGYPPLYDRFSSFYSRYVYRRVRDCWNYPICSVPGAEVTLKDRITRDNGWTFEFTGTQTKCINLGSYNYLGFAQATGPCAEYTIKILHEYGLSTGATRQNHGTCKVHIELEKLMAEFLGVDDAITVGMGFATNSLNIPTLFAPGCLVLSDEKNHASLILGIRLSGASVKVFRHNNMVHLEKLLREQIYKGQPDQPNNEYKPWNKIFIVVEGIYSMEGSIVNLPKVIALKKKYKAYLYLDEAHSIGAMGSTGRGVVDYFGCNPKDVDILMGTFTKSFGSAGGYIAGRKELVTYLRKYSYASKYATAMSPPLAAQIIAVLRILMGKDGTDEGKNRMDALARNTRYFRKRLAQIGVITYGNEDSPVVPILVYYYSKIAAMVRTLIKNKIATVGVGYPATPLLQGRIRICLSAAHTKEQLDYALDAIATVADELGLKYSRLPKDLAPIVYEET